MKQFLMIFAGSLLGISLAIFSYDYFIVQPRALAQAAAVSKSTQIDLRKAREQANEITTDLNTSVQQTVTDAQNAFTRQTSEQERHRLVNDAHARVQMHKVAITEFYMNAGHFPDNAKEVGLSNATEYAGGAVHSITIGAKGSITIALNDQLSSEAKIHFIPSLNPKTNVINWQCVGERFADLPRYLHACTSK